MELDSRLDMDFGYDLIDNGTSDDFYTPPFIFEALNVEFDMDVCAPVGGVPWIPAKRSLTIIEDGLITPWAGLVWCNPPFSTIRPWADKLVDYKNAIALLPLSKSVWSRQIWRKAAGIMILDKEPRYIKSDGTNAATMTIPVLMAFNESCVDILKNSGLGRVR